MTSFLIDEVSKRPLPYKWDKDGTCPFCSIIDGTQPAFRVFENDHVVAILDILPIRPGHTLVIPKEHHSRLSDLPLEYGRVVGEALTVVSRALLQALDHKDLNVVCNQGYGQAVPHVHFHIVPAPRTSDPVPTEATSISRTQMEMLRSEYHRRNELDDDEATLLCSKVKSKL